MTGFASTLTEIPPGRVRERLESVTALEVERLLSSERPLRAWPDGPVLLSTAARAYLEPMARRARTLTLWRFGRTMTLYAPLYLSSHCVNRCRYCGFSAGRSIERRRLTQERALGEARHLIGQGLRHLLLVSGEDPRCGVEEVAAVAAEARRVGAASVAVEIPAGDVVAYRRLAAAGVDGLVLYQETYLREVYAGLHPAGPKRDFDRRLAAVEAGGAAGLRALGIGALLGLAPFRLDAVYLALHAEHLSRRFPGARVALSFPRLRPVSGGVAPGELAPVVSDADLAQLIVAQRLLFPDAEIVLSTREPSALRDRLLPLGVTRISAGSCTVPGGYRGDVDGAHGQFEPHDRRSVNEIARRLRALGLDVVTKDFDDALSDPAPTLVDHPPATVRGPRGEARGVRGG